MKRTFTLKGVRNLVSLLAVLSVLSVLGSSGDEQTPKPFSRAKAALIISDARKIVTPNGVERLEKVRIGGIEQGVLIRGGEKRKRGALAVQRGAGKTYFLNDPTIIGPTMTPERMVADTEEMTTWIRKELGKEKIFVIGHSWGSYLGLELAKLHPELLYAYIGVGQVTDGPESERRGWAFAIDAARQAGNSEAVRQLESIAPYFSPAHPAPLKNIYTQRRWVDFYGGVMAHRRSNSIESDVSLLSPDYTDDEIRRIWDGNDFSESSLLATLLSLDLTETKELRCPLIIFS